MAYKKIEPVVYVNSYERQRETIYKLFYAWDDEGNFINCKGSHTSFFCKEDMNLEGKDSSFIKDYNNNKLPKGTNISGKVKQIPPQEYPVTMNISLAFKLIQDVMVTKNKTLRKSMETLKPYESNDLASLLHHLRSEWELGERGDVLLTYKEKYLLQPKKKTVAKGK